jgi:hypothetical protein
MVGHCMKEYFVCAEERRDSRHEALQLPLVPP